MGIPMVSHQVVTQVTPRGSTTRPSTHGREIVRGAWITVRTSIAVGRQTDELRSTSWMIASFRLPSVLSSYVLCLTFQLWMFRLSWPSLRHSLAIKEILPRDSLFVKACTAGNVEEAKQLALSGKGMPSSIDEAGRPMLHVNDHPSI